MNEFEPYSQYEKTCVDWLKSLPRHWKTLPINAVLEERGELNINKCETNILSVVKDIGVIPYSEKGDVGNKKSEEIERYKLVRKGDLVINSMNVIIGSVGISKYNGALSQIYLVLKIRKKKLLEQSYLGYIFQIRTFQQWLKRLGYGILDHRLRIPMDNLKREYLPIPTPIEQKAISNFLYHETARIDTLIEKQQRLIALLKEKRQAVISHAVTKGLDPTGPMKNSGVEWLGEVPEHWDAIRLKHTALILDCKHLTAEFIDEGVPLASIKEVQSWYVDLSQAKQTTKEFFNKLIEGNRDPRPGDIIYSRNATVGQSAIVKPDHPAFAMGQDVCLIRSVERIKPEFLMYHFSSSQHNNQLDCAMVGATFKRVNVEEITNFWLALPPLNEQNEIITYLKRRLAIFDKLVLDAINMIALLQERRTALISAAVTGKIDVRNHPSAQKPTSSSVNESAKEVA